MADQIKLIDPKFKDSHDLDIDTKWTILKEKIIKIVDKIEPLKLIQSRKRNQFPWEDSELSRKRELRDHFFYLKSQNKNCEDSELYRKYRSEYQSLNRKK